MVFGCVVKCAKRSNYYVRDCLKKIKSRFSPIWRHILEYFDYNPCEKWNFLSFGQNKNRKKVNFELETATFKFDQKWCLEKVQFSPIKSSKVDFFWIQRRKTKFPFRNQYRKFLFKPRFPKKSLFLILQTITDIIYWNFSHKTRKIISLVRI